MPDDSLAPGTPNATSVTPPVGGQVPGSGEAPDGSGVAGTEMVPKARFDGLMSSLNSEKAARLAAETELAALREPPPATRQEKEPVELTAESIAALVDQAVRNALTSQASAVSARDSVLARYPDVKAHFADLLVGETEAELEAVANALDGRLKAFTAAAKPAVTPPAGEGVTVPVATGNVTPPAAGAAGAPAGGAPAGGVTEPPSGAGTVTASDATSVDAHLAAAKAAGNMPDFLNGLLAKANLRSPDKSLTLTN